MNERIKNRLTTLSIGCVATLWDLLVWRVNANSWVVGHLSINVNEVGVSLDEAAEEFERLLD